MSQQVGITLGIPVMSSIIAAVLLQQSGDQTPQGVLGAVLPAIGINALLCLATAAAVAVFLRGKRTTAAL